jgi:outer membrane lipoprotein-sorting protein
MKRIIAIALVAVFAFGFVSSSTPAATASTMTSKTKAAKSMKCPFCGMKMMTHKSAGAPVAVKIKGVTYYCCAACAGGKKASHKM